MKIKQTWKIGDCLGVMKEYPDDYFDLILTDPPYGINICSNGVVGFGIKGHNKVTNLKNYTIQKWDSKRIDKIYFDEIFRVSKNQIIFGGNYYTDYLSPSSCWLVWDKDNSGKFADCELAWTSFKSATRLFKYRWNGMLQGDMANKEERVHPTQKPLPLFKWILQKYATYGDRICDPFCGSGTTLEACQYFGLECLGIDISDEWVPHYKKRLKINNSKLTDF